MVAKEEAPFPVLLGMVEAGNRLGMRGTIPGKEEEKGKGTQKYM